MQDERSLAGESGPIALQVQFDPLQSDPTQCLFPKTSLGREWRVRAQPLLLDRLVSIPFQGSRLHTTRARRLVAPERNAPGHYIRRPDNQPRLASEFLRGALTSRNSRRNVRRNQRVDEKGIAPAHSCRIPRAIVNR